ncbi:MAG: hypothetical protein JSS99_01935 [Actinobacteria bacterium]|nr:hypothetical protein [Actinomycetota bacterium]
MSDAVAGRRKWALTSLLVACVTVFALALGTSAAWAGKGVKSVFGSSGSAEGQFAAAGATAVNASSGDVYVVDTYNNRVQQFDADGNFIRTWGWGVADGSSAFQTCTSTCQAGVGGSGDGQFDTPQGIAIDQSDGSVYVVDGNNARVEKFTSAGAYVSQFGTAGSGDGQFSGPQGAAVDPSDGSVYVADTSNHRIEKFDSRGAYVSQFGSEGSGDGQFEGPTRVAVDSTGRIYVLDSGNSRVERFTSAGAFDEVFDTTDVFLPAEIAIGPSDHVYIAQWAQDFSEQRVIEVDPAGTLVDTHGVGSTANNSSGLALDGTGATIYLADGFNARVFIMTELTPATVSMDPISGITSDSASASGTVNPQGTDTSWHFEISTDESSWSPLASDQDAGSGSSDVPVSQSLTDLLPNQTYFVRLVAARPFNAPVISSDVQFTTDALAPTVDSDRAEDITPSHVVLRGFINPHHAATTYYFEYGPTTSYGTSVPVTQDGDAGSGNLTVEEFRLVGGLQPGTTYHYRLVATNVAGTSAGDDKTFTTNTQLVASACSNAQFRTGPSAALPDCRAYELVSPPDKNGGDVMGDSQRTRASASGDAVSFASLTGFGDVRGTGAAAEYLSQRTGQAGTNGWTTHGITPSQKAMNALALTGGVDPLWQGEFSADLSHGVFNAWSPVTEDPMTARVLNLYVRGDLRTHGPGSYDLVTACPACSSPLQMPSDFFALPTYDVAQPVFVGASADYSHVLFESPFQLTGDAPAGGPYLYEWHNGTVTLAGILPDGAPAPSAKAARPGPSGRGWYTRRTISDDGRRIFFATPDGALYMRTDNGTPDALTVKLNASERGTPDPNGPATATFWTATPSGSRVFFTSTEALTDDAVPGLPHLYAYDSALPDSDPHNLVLVSGGDVAGVIGASDDGHAVYFIAGRQIAARGPFVGSDAIFEWRDGAISYVARIQRPSIDLDQNLPRAQWIFINGFMRARVTPDGRALLFMSHSGEGVTGYDQGHACTSNSSLESGPEACGELYVYSEATSTVSCASCNPTGAPATSDGTDMVRAGTGGAVTAMHLNRSLTDDGRWAFFNTREALVPGDVNGRVDAYEYDTLTGEPRLLSTGKDPSDSYFLDASADGRNVFILTRQQLNGWDNDGNYDVYDVRVNGGVPDPVAPTVCTGDGCQGAQGSVPPGAVPGSRDLHSAGNVKQAKPRHRVRKCRRGTVRKKVKGRIRCVKKRRAHRHHHQRTRSASSGRSVR